VRTPSSGSRGAIELEVLTCSALEAMTKYVWHTGWLRRKKTDI
jgi:hypothetical protein